MKGISHLLKLPAILVAILMFAFPAHAYFAFNGQADNPTDNLGYYYIITGGKFPTGNVPNGDNASGGTFRWLSDDPTWGAWSLPINQWHKDDWFPDNASFALTLRNDGTIIYDNNGIEDGTYGDYYDGNGSHGIHGLYRGYSMANNFDWIYAGYFKLTVQTTFDQLIGYFDPNGGSSDPFPFNPNSPLIRYRMNIWSAAQDIPNSNSYMPAAASFTGDVFSSDLAEGVFSVSDTGVDRVFPVSYGLPPEDIWRLVFKLAQPVTLPAGVYFFSHDVVIPSPITSNVLATPNPAAVNTSVTLTANVDDTTTGGSDIASAEYSLDGGTTWHPMNAQDNAFNEVSEDVTVTFTAPAIPGIYNLCVRGTDFANNTGPEECIMLVVYDPTAGFVTGGGWIDSPADAYKLPEVAFFNGFETDTDGWDVFGSPYDAIRVASGTNGITSALGNWHAEAGTAATDWGGYNSIFPPGGYITSIEIYLDVDGGFTIDTRFDWTSAINRPDGDHRRDFIFNGGFYNDDDGSPGSGLNRFIFSASNNAPGWPKNPGRDPFAITASGWYTLQHRFYDGGMGVLAVDLSILDSSSNLVHTWTLSDPTDIIGTTAGGNRYGWFATNGFTFLAMDNSLRTDFTYPTGRANFGFVSKYIKGKTEPTGNTEFVFKAADLNFHSSSYDWLVVTGSNYARFKGAGTINGMNAPNGEPYKFMLWAGDGDPDTFHIKIWYEANDSEIVVYDNGMDQAIGGGSIVVHTPNK